MSVTSSPQAAQAERLRQLEGRFSLADAFASTVDLHSGAREALRILAGLSKVDSLAFYVLNDAREDLRLIATAGLQASTWFSSVRTRDGLPAVAYLSGDIAISNDVSREPQGTAALGIEQGSVVIIPFKRGREVLGVIALWSAHAGFFTAQLTQFLLGVTDEIAVFVENALVRDREKARADHLGTLLRASEILSAAAPLQEKAQQLVEVLASRLDLWRLSLRVADMSVGGLRLLATAGEPSSPPAQVIPFGSGIAGAAFERGEMVVSQDYPLELVGVLAPFGTRSAAAVPVRVGQQTVAVLVASSGRRGAFSSERSAILAALATNLAEFVENARIRDGEATRRTELEALLAISNALRGDGNYEERVSRGLEVLARSLQAPAIVLRVPDEHPDRLRVIAAAGSLASVSVPNDCDYQSLSGRVALSRQRAVINNYALTPGADPEWIEAGVHAVCILPVQEENKVIGVLSASSCEPNFFTDQRVQVLEAVAEQFGHLLEELRLDRERQTRLRELETLINVASALASPAVFDTKIADVLQELGRFSDALVVSLGELNEATNKLDVIKVIRQATDSAQWDVRQETVDPGEGLMGEVLRTGEAVVSNDYVTDRRARPRIVDAGVRSAVVLPLPPKGRGVMAIDSDLAGAFTEHRLHVLHGLLDEVGALLAHARLQHDLEASWRALDQRALESEILIRCGAALAGNVAHEEKIEKLLEALRDSFACEVAFLIPRPDGKHFEVSALSGDFAPDPPLRLMPIGQGIASEALRNERSVVSNDYATDTRAFPAMVRAGARSMVALPVHSSGTIGAILTLASQSRDYFDTRLVHVLEAVATGLGPILTDARLREELRQSNSTLNQRVIELARLNQQFQDHLRERFVVLEAWDELATRVRALGEQATISELRELKKSLDPPPQARE